MSRRKIAEALASRKATPSGMSIVKRVRTDDVPVEKIISETDEQISKLAENQTKVADSIDDIRKGFKSFTQPATYKPSLSDVSGSRSLHEYSNHEIDESDLQSLRDCGLSDEEIKLWLRYGQTSSPPELPSTSKVNPEVHRLRLDNIRSKITSHTERLSIERGFSSAQSMSRHKIELESVLNQGRAEQKKLSSLVIKPTDTSDDTDTPESQLKYIAQDLSDKKIPIPDYGEPFPHPWTPVMPKLTPSTEFIGPQAKDPDLSVSDDQLYRNRLTDEEIKQLPKFSNYNPGKPTQVLFVKNLASSVRHDHLIHMFGRFRIPGDRPITIKLMTGRMKGQAFVTCADTETATRCMMAIHGYKLKGRPMIITYGHTKPEKSPAIGPQNAAHSVSDQSPSHTTTEPKSDTPEKITPRPAL